MKKFLTGLGIAIGAVLLSASIASAANNIFQNGGNVGIGTTTPFGTLSITAPTTLGKAPAFIIASSTSLGADASSTFVVYPQGVGGVSVPVVGIGTSTPAQAGGKGPNLVISAPDGVAGALLRLVGHLASGNGNIIDGSCDAAGNNNCFNGLECLDSVSGGCTWRLFRSTSNAGNSQNAFEIYKGDGTASLNTHLTSNGGSSYIDALGGNLGIGTTTPSFPLQDNGVLALGSTANGGANIDVERTPGSNAFRPIIQTDATGNLFMSSPSGINTDLILGDNSQLSTGFNYQLQIHFPGSNSSGDAQIWMATSSGKVGIGNSAPTGKLEISGNISSGVADVLDISNPFTNTGTCARINWNFSTTLSAYQAYEEGCRSNATGAGATYLDWATNNGTALGERMRLSEAGNLGLGTTTPQSVLTVLSTSNGAFSPTLRLENSGVNSGTASGILFKAGNGSDGYKSGITMTKSTTGFGVGNLQFLQNSTADASDATLANAVMTLTSTGLVGIGTTTPTATFVSVAASSTVASTAYNGLVNIIAGLENGVTKLFEEIDQWGHLIVSGDAPSLTSCTGGSVGSNSNDRAGSVTVGTGLTSCGVLFAHPYPTGTSVHVFINQDTGTVVSADAQSISVTGFTVTSASILSGDVFSYQVTASQ